MIFRNSLAAALTFLGLALHSMPAHADTTQTATRKVDVYVVALEDGGKLGKKVGCGDSLVALKVQADSTTVPLIEAAMSKLVKLGKDVPGGDSMYNALASSDLRLKSARIKDGQANVELTGRVRLGGACDNPRFEGQLRETVLQFPEVKSATIRINGEPLEKVVSLR